jgi:hypothetical protein
MTSRDRPGAGETIDEPRPSGSERHYAPYNGRGLLLIS